MVDLKSIVPWRSRSQSPAPRDESYDPFVAFRREMDRVFDDFFSGLGTRGLAAHFGGWSGVTPTIDVTENDEEVVVTAEMPGLSDRDFEVALSGDLLTLRGEKRSEHEERNGNTHYVERRFGSFSRSVRLPFEVEDEKVDANYVKGVLTIRVAKPAELQKPVRRIDVQTV